MAKSFITGTTTRKKPVPGKQAGKGAEASPFSWLSGERGLRNLANGTQRENLLSCGSVTEILRWLNENSPVFSTAVFNLIEISLEDLKVKALTPDSTIHAIDTQFCKSFLRQVDAPGSKGLKGFNAKQGINSLKASLLQEVVLTGGVMVEGVVSRPDFTIDRIVPIPLESIQFKNDKQRQKYPVQHGVDLNYPTIFYASLHQSAASLAAVSMMQPAVGSINSFSEFVNDMERAVYRGGHDRTVVTLNKAMYIEIAPSDCQDDATKMAEWLETNRQQVSEVLEDLEPEDILVLYDDQKVEKNATAGAKADYVELLNTVAGILALSLKTHPSIIGLRLEGSQSLSNIEALTYLHLAKGVQRPVAEVLSRLLTLQLRLLGSTSVAEVVFDDIDLRPSTELEMHKLTRQTRVLSLLSLGMITDGECFYELNLDEPPESYVPLSGTGFMDINRAVNSTGSATQPQDGGADQTLNPDSKRNKVGKK